MTRVPLDPFPTPAALRAMLEERSRRMTREERAEFREASRANVKPLAKPLRMTEMRYVPREGPRMLGRLFWVVWVLSAVLAVALSAVLIRVLWALGTRLLG